MKIRQLVYLSSAVTLMEDDDLLYLLESARIRNEELGITGLLLYSDGCFIQVIEGDPANVEQLYRRIKRDPRHRRFLVLLDHVVEERAFEGWRMGFERLSASALANVTGTVDLWDRDGNSSRTAAGRLLDSFRRTQTTRSSIPQRTLERLK